jgi:hypothetical protein
VKEFAAREGKETTNVLQENADSLVGWETSTPYAASAGAAAARITTRSARTFINLPPFLELCLAFRDARDLSFSFS